MQLPEDAKEELRAILRSELPKDSLLLRDETMLSAIGIVLLRITAGSLKERLRKGTCKERH